VVTLWIGDFRTKQLQKVYRAAGQTAEYHYITDDLAEYSWFKDNAAAQLPLLSLENANIIIMLGFIDCLYSCVWDSFKADKIAAQYADLINKLVTDYSSFNFYVCSVNPINAAHPFAESPNGFITQKHLSEKIGIFNNTLKEKCKAEYIDSYDYLVNTSFETRDGVRYTNDTCITLHNYISANLKSSTLATFLPRLVEPNPNSDTYLYWTPTTAEGANPFPATEFNKEFTLPSCEAYAWGRFYEILGEEPKLSTGKANAWYSFDDGYKRGEEPRIGSIACWTSLTSGFVAVVEQVREDGSIITSESGWDTDGIWRLFDRIKGADGRWEMPSSYTFQGFIYCPTITPTASIGSLDKSTVTTKAEALTRSEMEGNAKYIWNYLGSKGWSLNAVAGMLGNMQYESTINPGRHQVGSGENGGFGLVQWTPKKKLVEWLTNNGYPEDDMDGQLERILWEKENNEQYAKNKYKYTFDTFSTSLDNPYTLACAFAFDYERSWVTLWGTEAQKEVLRKERGGAAEEWYNFLAPYSPSTVIEERFTLDNFKLDSITPTKIKASFIIRNGTDSYYLLFDEADKELLKESLPIRSDTSRLQTISFNCDKKILPNTEYTLKIQATGTVGENTLTRSIKFTTPQDLPEPVKSIKLSCSDKIKSINSTFKLDVEMPSSLGYWSKNGSGYDELLIVNGKVVKTKVINNIENITAKKFTIKDEFGYSCKIGDVIQIGIRIWVTDDKNKKIYDNYMPKTSEVICIMNSSIQAYLIN
jgi:surface antigen